MLAVATEFPVGDEIKYLPYLLDLKSHFEINQQTTKAPNEHDLTNSRGYRLQNITEVSFYLLSGPRGEDSALRKGK